MTTSPKISWNGSEYQLDFASNERDVLRSVAEQMRTLIIENDPDTYRLFPPAYMNDIAKQEEYRSFMSDELMKMHLAALDVLQEAALCETLHEDDLYAFVRAVNHVRLVLGTRLDIDEETDVTDISEDHPDAMLYDLYFWMGWVLEEAVEALSGNLPEPAEDT